METNHRKIIALVVGINAYPNDVFFEIDNLQIGFPKLHGCVSDAEKMANYLNDQHFIAAKIDLLTDKAATKQNIVNWFLTEAVNADKGDVVFFYFSGHGAQEKADDLLFNQETDGKIENIVCYYENKNTDFLLADKEFRWLLNKVSQNGPHVVSIFDCCHSGDNVRDISFSDVVKKRLPSVLPARTWEQFVFSNSISITELRENGMDKVLPEGKHIQFAACESNGTAVEIGGEGVFTKTLLSVLNSCGGEISYYHLKSRIMHYMREVYEQKPNMYIANENEGDIFGFFLNLQPRPIKVSYAEIVYNEDLGWQLNMGGIHGIGVGQKFDAFSMKDSNHSYTARIDALEVGSATITIEGSPDVEDVLSAQIPLYQEYQLYVSFNPATPKTILGQFLNENGIIPVEEDAALYSLRVLGDELYITHPHNPYRPLTNLLPLRAENTEAVLLSYFRQIRQWEFLKSLGKGQKGFVDIEIMVSVNGGAFEAVKEQEININFVKRNGTFSGDIRVSVTNRSIKNLYCACTYLMSDFSSNADFLTPSVKMLEEGETVYLQFNNDSTIGFYLDQVMYYYNWTKLTDYFLFVVSENNFDVSQLTLQPIPSAPLPEASRHLVQRQEHMENLDQPTGNWHSQLVALNFINPSFNGINPNDLKNMLEAPKTTAFARALYHNDNNA